MGETSRLADLVAAIRRNRTFVLVIMAIVGGVTALLTELLPGKAASLCSSETITRLARTLVADQLFPPDLWVGTTKDERANFFSLGDIATEEEEGRSRYCSGTLTLNTTSVNEVAPRVERAILESESSTKKGADGARSDAELTRKLVRAAMMVPIIAYNTQPAGIRLSYRAQLLDDGKAYVTILSRRLTP